MPTIEDWLNGLGLGKYAETFEENDVDLRALPHLESVDLKDLGVSLGHRKIILAAIAKLRDSKAPEGENPPAEEASPAPAVEPVQEPAETTAGDAAPDLRLLSVLFCDMVGSTGLSGRFNAEEMHDLIGAYQDTVASAVTLFGGYVAKFLGDGVLAYFGWPMAYEDHAERAIRAGLAAIAGVGLLKAPSGQPLHARVGIASGRVVVGDLAGGGVLDRGQVAGETPNLAARLQGIAQPGEIVIADTTRRLAGHVFEFADLGGRELKGFEGSVPAFRVEGEREVESRFDAARGDAMTHFVGRGSEIGMLLDRWELAKSGQGQAVFVTGEAGIGKSRLLEALVERLQKEPHELIRLQCSPYHETSALYPIIQRMARFAGFTAGDDAAARTEKLMRLVAQYGEDPDEVGWVYSELLSLDLRDRFKPLDLPTPRRKEFTVGVLVNRPFLAAKRAPVVLLVEDAHWIDPSTNEILKEVVSRIPAAPIFVIVSHRPEWSAGWASGQSHVTSVAIGRLARPQMRELIESMLGPVSDSLVERIADRTDGVPLFVEELTRSIRESGETASENIEIPDSLQGSLMARLDRLPVPSKEVAQIASVIGREFDRSLLAEVVTMGGPALDGALRQLLAAQLVVMGGLSHQSLIFRHALIQDTAYQSLLSRKRRQYHQAIADTIVRSHPKVVTTQPELVARHYTEAQRTDLALPFWKKGGERALERFANYEAVDHLTNALNIAEALPEGPERHHETLSARLLLAEALAEAGQLLVASTHFHQAAAQALAAGDTANFLRAAFGYDHALFLAGVPLDASVGILTQAEAVIDPGDDKHRCLILTRLARAYVFLGNHEKSESSYTQALELARRLDDRDSLFDLLTIPFIIPRAVASSEEKSSRIEALDELVNLAGGIKDEDARARAHSVNIYVSAELGARDRVERSLAALREQGEVRQQQHVQWIARHGAAMLAILNGDFGGAETLAGQALEIGQRTHGEQVEGVYGIQMFSIRREQGRLSEVAPVMKRFIDENPDETTWLPGFALVAADLGFVDPARRRLSELAETGFEMPFDAKRSASLSYVAEVAALLGDAEPAARLYDLLSPYAEMTITAGIVTVCYGAAGRYLGMLAATLGEFDKAEAHFERALEIDTALGARPWLAHTQAEYALLLRQRGRAGTSERAERLANEAWEIAGELGMVRLQRRLQPQVH